MEVRKGFKQTDVGVIPEDWDVVLLDLVAKRGSGHTPNKRHPEYWNGDIKWISLKDASSLDNLYIEDTVDKITLAGIANSSAVLHPAETVVLSRDAGVGKSTIMRTSMAVSQHFMAWQCGSQLNNHFLYYWLQSEKSEFERIAIGSTIKTIGLPYFKALKIPLPTLAEQEAIAEALSDADALIESLETLLAKKRQAKQGAMSELLTGKRRLVESGEWKETSLGELGSTFGGLTGKTKSDFGNGASQYITFMNIMSNVMIDSKIFERVNIKPSENQNRVRKGDLFFNGSSETPEEVGMCAVLTEDVQDVFLNSFCFGYRFREGAKVNGLYFAYFFRSHEGRELMKSLAQGATRYNLSKTALLRLKFPLPDLPEQTAIAEILSDMDKEIRAMEEKLSKARAIKAGMMSTLLTGRVRLV